MLVDKTVDFRQLVKEMDYSCKYSSETTIEVVRILRNFKRTGLINMEKLQKVMNHYAIDVLKPR